jgi:hypothetical protein
MNRLTSIALAAIPALCALAVPAAGQDASARLQQALDQPVQLELTNAGIGELFDQLAKDTGVKFVLSRETLDHLPYGTDTRLDATVKNATLRQALGPILAKEGLKWEIEGDSVVIQPSEPLVRMCKRATFEELTILGTLLTARIAPPSEGGPVTDQLRKLPGLEDVSLVPHVKLDPETDYARADRVLPGTGADWLNMLCHGKGWTWRLSGGRIAIVEEADQVRRQLETKVTLSYQNAPLVKILLDLAGKAHVRLAMAPGVMNLLPDSTRERFNLTMGEAPVEQALQVISGATGLEFAVTAEGVEVRPSAVLTASATTQPARQRSPYFVQLSLPGPDGVTIQVFMRPEELPEDVVRKIDEARDAFIAKLRGENEPPKEDKP